MTEKTIVDLHTHSVFSPDAKDPVEKMIAKAKRLGMTAFAVTDHCDCNMWDPAPSEDITDAMMYGAGTYALDSIAEQYRIKQELKGKLHYCVGIELGQPLQNPEKAELIAGDERLDLIIGSHHMNEGMDDFYYLKYDQFTADEIKKLYIDYFRQVLKMVIWGKIDVLGHLTYPSRYIVGEYGIKLDEMDYLDYISEILLYLIDRGIGIEINTSGLRQKYGRTFPTVEYIKQFHDLGGEIVTIGSDAHSTVDVGKGINEGIEIAKAAGFRYITYFEKHKPIFIPI